MLEVRLLGKFDIRVDGRPVEIPLRAAQSLLAYLMLNPGTAHRREQLAGLIWPDMSESNAKANLRHTLWRIRKALGERDYLLADDLTITFDPAAAYWLDAAIVDRKVVGAMSADELLNTVLVYRGELLPGFYDEWVVLERERLQAAFENKMKLLMDRLVETRRWEDILEWAERWIALGHVPEPAYRALMLAHAGMSDLSKMAAAYRRGVEALKEELRVEPSEQTRTLYERLARGERLPGMPAEAALSPPDRAPSAQEVRQAIEQLDRPTAIGSLPIVELSPLDRLVRGRLVGREREMSEALTHWQRAASGEGQVLLISGEPGIGKTRLIRELAARVDMSGGQVFIGECYVEGGAPYAPMAQIIETALNPTLTLPRPQKARTGEGTPFPCRISSRRGRCTGRGRGPSSPT